jgi:hypothetical protein
VLRPKSSCEVSNIFAKFYSNLEFLDGVSNKSSKSYFTEIPAGAALIHADRRTDVTSPIEASKDCANAPKTI